MGVGRIFDISARSLATYQRAIDVTSHNIANSNNVDYSRQEVNLAAAKPDIAHGFTWGSGVTLADISRVRNTLVDNQIRNNNPKYFENQTRSNLLSQVESLFTEPSDLGIGNLTTEFFNSWQELATTPNSTALRDNVLRSAQKISAKVGSISEGLDSLKTDILNTAKSKIDSLNSTLHQIQTLNAKIFEQTTMGLTPNDLLDERDKAIDQLSQMANINVSYDNTNTAIISVGGAFAVDRSNVNEFSLQQKDDKLMLVSGNDKIASQLNSGEIYGMLDVYSNSITQYQSGLDNYIKTLVDSVNSVHQTGYTITNPPQTGLNFFNNYTSGKLSVNQAIVNDPSKIAASGDGTGGNGSIALAINNISTQKIFNGVTLSDGYSNLVSQLGTEKLSASQMTDSNKLILDQLNTQKASYSGVSLDEEMTNIIKFQRSYDASAKLVKVADEMLQTIIQMV